jgi:hypothetical protein
MPEVSEMSLSDNPEIHDAGFPSGSTMPPESFLVIEFDHSKPSSATNTGFGLDEQGDRVYLFDARTREARSSMLSLSGFRHAVFDWPCS